MGDRIRTWWLACILAAVAAMAPAQPWAPPARPVEQAPTAAVAEEQTTATLVQAKIDPGTLEIGTPAVVTAELPDVTDFTALAVEPTRAQTNAVMIGEAKKKGPRTWEIPVRFLTSKYNSLEPLAITATTANGESTAYRTPQLPVLVTPPGGPDEEPRDYSSVMGVPLDKLRAALILGGLGLIGLLFWSGVAYGIWRFMKNRAAQPAGAALPTLLPPLDEIRKSIEGLSTLEVYRARGAEAHYTELSFAIRWFLERQFGIPGLEMSDDELVQHVRRDGRLHSGQSLLPPLFERASLAKFARNLVNEETVRNDLASLRAFVDSEADVQRQRAAMAANARMQEAR